MRSLIVTLKVRVLLTLLNQKRLLVNRHNSIGRRKLTSLFLQMKSSNNVGSLVLSASRFKVWTIYPSVSLDCVLDFLSNAFETIEGVPEELITVHEISETKNIIYNKQHHLEMIEQTFKNKYDIQAYALNHLKELERFNEQLSELT